MLLKRGGGYGGGGPYKMLKTDVKYEIIREGVNRNRGRENAVLNFSPLLLKSMQNANRSQGTQFLLKKTFIFNSYISAARCGRPVIFQSMKSVNSMNDKVWCIKRFTTSSNIWGCDKKLIPKKISSIRKKAYLSKIVELYF